MTTTYKPHPASTVGQSQQSALLRGFASPWMALAWLLLIFIHETLGSAFYPLRQALELNEMQWFNGPFSALLWGGLCLSLVTASVIRVPWTWPRAGTHLTHLSVLLLVIASAIYFGNKIEGETLVTRHVVEVVDASGQRVRLLPNPGYARQLGELSASVQAVDPRTAITGRDGKPQLVWSVTVSLSSADGRNLLVTLVENHPELTRYAAQGRIPSSYLPEVRGVLAANGSVSVLGTDGSVRLTAKAETGATSEAGEWRLAITGVTPDWPLLAEGHQGKKGTMIAFSMRTPSGQQDGSTIIDLPTLTRFQKAQFLRAPEPRLATLSLAEAPVTRAYHQDRFALWLRPADGQQAYTVLPLDGLPRYRDHGRHVGGTPLALEAGALGNARFSVTGFAPYATPNTFLVEDPAAAARPLLAVQFDDGQGPPAQRRLPPAPDITELDTNTVSWFRVTGDAEREAVLAALRKRYPAGTTVGPRDAMDVRLVFLSRADGTVELVTGEPGRGVQHQALTLGNHVPVSFADQSVQVRVEGIFERPRQELLPVPVPPERRQSRMSVGLSQSWIEVEARCGERQSRLWIPYSPFAELPEDIGQRETVLGSYAPRPSFIEVPGAGRYEVLYGRVPFDLPGSIWMTGFAVPRRPGVDDPMEFYCDVAYGDLKQPSRAVVHMNHPLEWNGTFFFQAGWDPNTEALSVLGVGNRPGGWFLLWSSVLLTIGMIWSGVGMAMRKGER